MPGFVPDRTIFWGSVNPLEGRRALDLMERQVGKLLFWCGEDKIIYGSEAPIFHPQWALRAFMDFQIPEDCAPGTGTRSSPTRPSGRSSGGTCSAFTER